MLRGRTALLLMCLVAAPAASEPAPESETIWLRGRGSDVWIERGGDARISRDGERAGLTRVESPSPAPVAAATGDAVRRHAPTPVVVLSGPYWAYDAVPYEHDYSPRFYYPRYSWRLHPHHDRHRFRVGRPYRSHHGFGVGYAPRHHRSHPIYRGPSFGSYGHKGRHPGNFRGFGGDGAYRNAGPYGGQVRSGGHVLRGGAYRRTR